MQVSEALHPLQVTVRFLAVAAAFTSCLHVAFLSVAGAVPALIQLGMIFSCVSRAMVYLVPTNGAISRDFHEGFAATTDLGCIQVKIGQVVAPSRVFFPRIVSSNVHTHVLCAPCMDAITEHPDAQNAAPATTSATLAMPLRNRGRRSTLAMPLPKSWQAQHSVHLGVCLCGRGRIRQLSRGTGCCRARGGGRAKSWQAQHFGDAVAKSWQAQHFGDAVAEVVAGAAFCASGCVFVWQGSHSAAV